MKLLEVHIWNNLVGILSYDGVENKTFFEYHPDFLKNNLELSPLLAPKKKGVSTYEYSFYDSYKGLPEFISDSLPDKFGTDVFKTYLQANGISKMQVSPLDRLAYRGNRAMGALEFKPSELIKNNKEQLNIDLLSEVSNQIANAEPIGEYNEAVYNLFELGTSPGGAQPKIIINKDVDGNLFRGDTPLLENQTSWLLKFNNPNDDFGLDKGKVEYAYYLMAVKAGINMNDSELINNNGEQLFITKRFDRIGGKKLHMQTAMAFARMDWKNKTYGYEDLFKILQFINGTQKDKQELFRRMVFNALGKNIDDHTKNFSFLMDETGTWSLAPAYDVLFTAKYGFKPAQENHFLSINGKRKGFVIDDFKTLANHYNIKNSLNIIDKVKTALTKWEEIATELFITDKHINFILNKINVL